MVGKDDSILLLKILRSKLWLGSIMVVPYVVVTAFIFYQTKGILPVPSGESATAVIQVTGFLIGFAGIGVGMSFRRPTVKSAKKVAKDSFVMLTYFVLVLSIAITHLNYASELAQTRFLGVIPPGIILIVLELVFLSLGAHEFLSVLLVYFTDLIGITKRKRVSRVRHAGQSLREGLGKLIG